MIGLELEICLRAWLRGRIGVEAQTLVVYTLTAGAAWTQRQVRRFARNGLVMLVKDSDKFRRVFTEYRVKNRATTVEAALLWPMIAVPAFISTSVSIIAICTSVDLMNLADTKVATVITIISTVIFAVISTTMVQMDGMILENNAGVRVVQEFDNKWTIDTREVAFAIRWVAHVFLHVGMIPKTHLLQTSTGTPNLTGA